MVRNSLTHQGHLHNICQEEKRLKPTLPRPNPQHFTCNTDIWLQFISYNKGVIGFHRSFSILHTIIHLGTTSYNIPIPGVNLVHIHTYMFEQIRFDLGFEVVESPASTLPSPMMELTAHLPTVLPWKSYA